MSLNLHSAVRGPVQAVNADTWITYLQSVGNTPNSSGKQVPSYAAPITVRAQIQPPSGTDLKHLEFLNVQGLIRTVFMYSDPQAVVRVAARGGDLLVFPPFRGQPPANWLVREVAETWNVERGWTKLYAVLQTDSAVTGSAC